jgi:trigger factor
VKTGITAEGNSNPRPFFFVIRRPTGKEQRLMTEQTEQEKSDLKNTVTIEDIGPCKKKITVEIPAERIEQISDEQYGELSRQAVVPGFRKGRAPRRLLEKRFGKETSEQIKLKLLAEASEAAIKDNELDILGEPDIDYEKVELPAEGPMKFGFEVEVRPQFELPSLEGIPLERTKLEITDEQVDGELGRLCRYSGIWTPRKEDDAVQADDQIIADAVLRIEGVEEEERHDNVEIYVRPTGFVGPIPVEKLDELLIGAKAGDTRKTSIQMSKTFFREQYRQKKIEVEITVKDIKYIKPAEINEMLLANYGAASEQDLKEQIRVSLQARLERQARLAMVDQVYKYMLDKTKFELPADVTANYSMTLLRRQYANLLSRGLPREQIEEQMEQLRAGSDQRAEEQLRTFFIMDKVAKQLEVEVNDEELNGQIAALAMQQGQRPERLRHEMERNGSLEQFRQQIRDEKCLEKLLESAKVTEVEPQKAPEKPKKVAKAEEKPRKTAKKTARAAGKSTEKKASSDKSPAKKQKKTTKKKTG